MLDYCYMDSESYSKFVKSNVSGITGISVCFQQYFSTVPIHNGNYESKNALYIIIARDHISSLY